jgi:L-rhamnose isomerase
MRVAGKTVGTSHSSKALLWQILESEGKKSKLLQHSGTYSQLFLSMLRML